MNLNELRDKATSLPLTPGVYIMRNVAGEVIYVGKAKKLRNRVSQYFQDTGTHSIKTKTMVSKVCDFDIIIADSEFEALVLECSLIKQYQPKYNILLKDDKGYPFVRVNFNDAYPELSIVNHISNDKAMYFGPFGNRSATQKLIKTIKSTLKLPDCGKRFPKEIGTSRPCLNYHLDQCAGWCQPNKTPQEYNATIQQAKQLLSGNYRNVVNELREQMLKASEDLNFELAAELRNKLRAVEALGKRQLVTAVTSADTDVIGYGQSEAKACFSVLHFSKGDLVDKDFSLLSVPDSKEYAVSALLKQYYLKRGFAPKNILLPFEVDDLDSFSLLLQKQYNKTVKFSVPQRGDKLKLVTLACKNAFDEAERATDSYERANGVLTKLGGMLGISAPTRIESFDISNISGTDIVAGMVVFVDGKPKASDFKRFKLDKMEGQDDYKAMRTAVERRFQRFLNNDAGFDVLPDLLLIDGGDRHAAAAARVLAELGIELPVFGMVKDDRHRTRALVTRSGQEIGITAQQSVFSFVGRIQEATHNYAIGYHKKLRSKRLKYSELDKISGVGLKRKQILLKTFKSVSAIRAASLLELERVLPKKCAYSVYEYFRDNRKGSE